MKFLVVFLILVLFSEESSQKCDGSCKNKHRDKKSRNSEDDLVGSHHFSCKICDDERYSFHRCHSRDCDEYVNSTKKFDNCVSAFGTNKYGDPMSYQNCTYEGSDICDVLKRSGFDSCSTCAESDCNEPVCYFCYKHYPLVAIEVMLTPCKRQEKVTCNLNLHEQLDYKCYSAKTVLNGQDIVMKNCIKVSMLEDLKKYLESYGFSYYICDSPLCNKHDEKV